MVSATMRLIKIANSLLVFWLFGGEICHPSHLEVTYAAITHQTYSSFFT